MAHAVDVAGNLIRLAAGEDEPEQLTHLRLQKLLYYVQGWSLALRDKAMFQERIEAWPHGPVVKDVWKTFSGYASQPIPLEAAPPDNSMDDDDRELTASVWSAYKGFTASGLRQMTHDESPWKDARRGLSETAPSTREITVDAMAAYFAQRANRNCHRVAAPATRQESRGRPAPACG